MITSVEDFENKTALMLSVFMPPMLGEKVPGWFAAHVSARIRYMHANNPGWRKWLENRVASIDPRDQCKVWIKHWFDAYQLDPERYRERHPEALFN
jgi:hypothetical protein